MKVVKRSAGKSSRGSACNWNFDRPAESVSRPEVDVVARGEGEEIWIKLCDIIENSKKSKQEKADKKKAKKK